MAIRIYSAIVGIIIAFIILFFSDTLIFHGAIAVLSILIVYELLNANKCFSHIFRRGICFIFSAALPFMSLEVLLPYRMLFSAVCVFLMFVTYLISFKNMTFDKLAFMMVTTALVSMSMCSLLIIKDIGGKIGTFLVALTLASAWIGDSAAYFVGTAFGKHKLCPEISPKKTIEGAVGGVLFTGIILAVTCAVYAHVQAGRGIELHPKYLLIVIIGMICSMLGIFGDLSASLLKRQCQIKDYGSIMPGHGGVLDRFDSVLFVAPFMYFVLTYINIFE